MGRRQKEKTFPVRTLEECFASLQAAQADYARADGRGQIALSKALRAIAEAAIRLGERDADRLDAYIAVMIEAESLRRVVEMPRELAIARARRHATLHAGKTAAPLAEAKGASYEPGLYRLADATAPPAPLEESGRVEEMQKGVAAYVRFNQAGRFDVEVRLVPTLEVDVAAFAMSATHLVSAPSGRLLLQGGAAVADAEISVPAGSYDAVFCTFQGQRHVLVLLAPTERRSNELPLVDILEY